MLKLRLDTFFLQQSYSQIEQSKITIMRAEMQLGKNGKIRSSLYKKSKEGRMHLPKYTEDEVSHQKFKFQKTLKSEV